MPAHVVRRALSGGTLLFCASLVVGCPPPVVTPDGGGEQEPWPLDTVLGPGEVRCGPVERASELIGGTLAFGQVGHGWRCHNSLVRFVVQDTERPFGNSSIGGNLIDFDLVRGDEDEVGHDEFREHVVAFGAHEVVPEEITVLDDGRTGEVGIIRVRGHPGDLTLAPQASFLAQDLPAEVITDYILRPDVPWVEVKTTLINESDDQLYGILFADFVAFGGGNQAMTPEHGFEDLDFFAQASYLAAGGSETSYAFVCPDSDATVMFGDSGITGPLCTDDVIVVQEASYSRYLIAGDGTLESVTRAARELRGLPSGTLSGQVTDAAGQPAALVHVAALVGGEPLDEGARLVNRTRTDEQGRYTLTLAPGEVRVVAYRPQEARAVSGGLEVVEGSDANVDLQLPATVPLTVDATFLARDGGGLGALPSNLRLEPLDGAYVPSRALGEFHRDGQLRSEPSADGHWELDVPPGRYRLWVSRGFAFTRASVEVDLAEGSPGAVQVTLTRVLDDEGLVPSEFHQHSLMSTDAVVPVARKVLENAAEGIRFAASTDHDNITDFAPYVRSLGLEEHLTVVPGNEVSFQAIGHFNVYPWDIDPADPYRDVGTRLWWDKNVPDLFDLARSLAGDPVIQINHVRKAGSGMLAALRFNPIDGSRTPRDGTSLPGLAPDVYDAWPEHFDAIELNLDLGQPSQFTDAGRAQVSADALDSPGDVPGLADYLGLLGAGLTLGATAVSDTHEVAEGVGYPRTFVGLGTVEPSGPAVVQAIRDQQTWGGSGCLVELRVAGERRAGLSQAIGRADLATLEVRVQAPDWVPMNRVELYANGRVLPLRLDGPGLVVDEATGELSAALDGLALDDTVRAQIGVTGLPEGDLVVMAVARGGSLAPTGPGSAGCWSAPLYVEDGDGWTGWLEATQTIVP